MKKLLHVLAFVATLAAITAVHAQVPQLINYQGRVAVGTVNFDSSGQFKFALVNATGTTTYWSNDGTSTAGSEPTAAVALTVTKGLYSVLLGDATLPHMTIVPGTVFANADVRLRIWFNDGTNGSQLLTPDQRIAAVGYAMMAGNVPDGTITSAKIAAGAVGSAQLAPNLVASGNFSAASITASGVLNLPTTISASVGVIAQNGTSLLQTYGSNNFFAGAGAGNFSMTGSNNTASGSFALQANTTGSYNAALGEGALSANTTGGANTALGDRSLLSNTTGSFNTASGQGALYSNTTGANNAASGYGALFSNTTASGNTAHGSQALTANTTGSNNTAGGFQALQANTTGSYNAALGEGALSVNTTGGANTALGDRALLSNTTGTSNTASGQGALYGNTVGANNTAGGYGALFNNTTGASNIALGYQAGSNLTTGSNNIDIGHVGVAGESNIIRVGTAGTHTDTYLTGVIHGDGSGLIGVPAATCKISGFVTCNPTDPNHTFVYARGTSSLAYVGNLVAGGYPYQLTLVDPGTYTVVVRASNGLETSTVVTVAAGQTLTNVNITPVDLLTDASNCGGCGNVCSLANASSSCTAGSCQVSSCTFGFANCDNTAANGCEININTSVSNCGSCGSPCSPNNMALTACTSGVCSGACAAGFADCNSNKQVDGCEVNIATSATNCGVCGKVCSTANMATTTCAAGVCNGTCNAGFADCDGNKQTNGCETNISSNPNNCGVCGRVCSGGTPNCVAGVCHT